MSEYDKIADRARVTSTPWTVEPRWDAVIHEGDFSPPTMYEVVSFDHLIAEVTSESDANLIAAAPYLLAALEGMQTGKGCFDTCRWEYSGRHHAICLEATYAIAIARGSV